MQETLLKIIDELIASAKQDKNRKYEQILVKLLDDLMTAYNALYIEQREL